MSDPDKRAGNTCCLAALFSSIPEGQRKLTQSGMLRTAHSSAEWVSAGTCIVDTVTDQVIVLARHQLHIINQNRSPASVSEVGE